MKITFPFCNTLILILLLISSSSRANSFTFTSTLPLNLRRTRHTINTHLQSTHSPHNTISNTNKSIHLVTTTSSHVQLLENLNKRAGGIADSIYCIDYHGNVEVKGANDADNDSVVKIFVNVHERGSGSSSGSDSGSTKSDIGEVDGVQRSDYELAFYTDELQTSPPNSSISSNDEQAWLLTRQTSHINSPIPNIGSLSTFKFFGLHTFFLSLTSPSIQSYTPAIMKELLADSDGLEVRADLLDCCKPCLVDVNSQIDRFAVLRDLQNIRLISRKHSVRAPMLEGKLRPISDSIPIVFTVRSCHQAGTWPDCDAGIDLMFEILKLGLREGVDVLDVEGLWSKHVQEMLKVHERRNSRSLLLGSHHVPNSEVSDAEAIELAIKCKLNGKAHAIKLVLSTTQQNKHNYDQALNSVQVATVSVPVPVPSIGLCLGSLGQPSRISNPRYTPVTHPSLPSGIAAPGQMSARDIMFARVESESESGAVQKKTFTIIGEGISYSLSPKMHSKAFEVCGLPYTYNITDVPKVTDFTNSPMFTSPLFGGCSVTIPFKTDIMPFVSRITNEASVIGAVNTVYFAQQQMVGGNTDWIGVYKPLSRRLKGLKDKKKKKVLIVGAGGAARAAIYACNKLDLDITIINRTPLKAHELAKQFEAHSIDCKAVDHSDINSYVHDDANANANDVDVVIFTTPGESGFTFNEINMAKFGKDEVIVFDMNYKPTSLSQEIQAYNKNNNNDNNSNRKNRIELIRGGEMLYEQGAAQFELWTGRMAPWGVMKGVVEKAMAG